MPAEGPDRPSERESGLAILWLFGPPGVGKSVVGWELFSRLAALGRPCAFVDIDQLGMCYPAPPSDPHRHRLKADNLAAVAAGYAQAGARGLIVAGVLDPDNRPQLGDGLAPGTVLFRLRAEAGELKRRLDGRGAQDLAEGAVREAVALDRTSFADAVVDTTGRSVEQVVGDLARRLGTWPAGVPAGPVAAAPPSPVPGPVLWLWGATGVGKSTIGFRAYLDLVQEGVAAAYVDVDQLGFFGAAPIDHRLRARNLSAVWSRYRSAGAEAMIAVGPIDSPAAADHYRAVLPQVAFCGLGAGRQELERRILSRRAGGSWAQPGDPLRGRPVTELLEVAGRAFMAAGSAPGPGSGARIHTDGMTPHQAAAAVLAIWRARPGSDR